MSSKKEILNSLSHLKAGSVEQVEFHYEAALNAKIYYHARRLGLRVQVIPERNRWVVSLRESKKPIVAFKTKSFNLDILYASCVFVKQELLTTILFENATEQQFKELDPVQEMFDGMAIEFSSRGMELSLKSEEDKEQEEMYDRED